MEQTTRCPTYSTISPHRVAAGAAPIGIAAACTTSSRSRGLAVLRRCAGRARCVALNWAAEPARRKHYGRLDSTPGAAGAPKPILVDRLWTTLELRTYGCWLPRRKNSTRLTNTTNPHIGPVVLMNDAN